MTGIRLSLWRAVSLFRIITLALCIFLITRWQPLYDRPGIAGLAGVLMVVWTACLCWLAVPGLLTATVSAFFSGRGQSTVVIGVNAVGLVVTAALDYCLIFGHLGFPEWGLVGAGWATVAGASASATLGFTLMFRERYRRENATARGWRFERPLFLRFLRYGLPSAAQWARMLP